MINLLSTNPVLFVALVFAMLLSLAFHEFSHAWMGNYLGDTTAKDYGRLTINPLAHIDPLGLLLFLLIGFGWGKPVPFDPDNLKYKKFGPALVGLAGPAANFLLVLLFGIFIKILLMTTSVGFENTAVQFFLYVVLINGLWMLFNLIPIPPLDGSKILFSFLPDSLDEIKFRLEQLGPFILFTFIFLDQLVGISFFDHLSSFVFQTVARVLGG